MPSPQFIKSYFSSFTDDIISKPLQKGEKKDEDKDKEGEAAEVTGRWDNIYPGSTEQSHSSFNRREFLSRLATGQPIGKTPYSVPLDVH